MTEQQGSTTPKDALRKVDEYRRWLGSHEFPEVSRVLDNLYAELNGEGLNAGTPRESDNCVISSLREQLRNRRAATQQSATAGFKNFHRLLCERFDYCHDERDWQRDQLSLIEHIAVRASAGKLTACDCSASPQASPDGGAEAQQAAPQGFEVCGPSTPDSPTTADLAAFMGIKALPIMRWCQEVGLGSVTLNQRFPLREAFDKAFALLQAAPQAEVPANRDKLLRSLADVRELLWHLGHEHWAEVVYAAISELATPLPAQVQPAQEYEVRQAVAPVSGDLLQDVILHLEARNADKWRKSSDALIARVRAAQSTQQTAVARCNTCGGTTPVTGRLDRTGECVCKVAYAGDERRHVICLCPDCTRPMSDKVQPAEQVGEP